MLKFNTNLDYSFSIIYDIIVLIIDLYLNIPGVSSMEKQIQNELNLLKKTILETVPVEQIFLFGSYAEGTSNVNSDLDILVIMPDNTDIREIDAMKLIHKAIGDIKTMPVDIIVSKKSKFNQRKATPSIERQIDKEGVIIYG